MLKRASKASPRDVNQLAAKIVVEATREVDEDRLANGEGELVPGQVDGEKNAAAVELGRRGGLKGGRARAATLSPEQRKAIAKRAAEARWKRAKTPPSGSGQDKSH